MNYSRRNTQKKQKRLVSKQTKFSKKISYTFFKLFVWGVLLLVTCGCAAGIATFRAILDTAPDITDIKESVQLEGFQSTIYDVNGKELMTLSTANSNRVYTKYEDIPEDLANAFIAIEDQRFWDHNGIDAKGILRAFFVGLSSGSFSEGASTITQQLIKNQIFNVGLNEVTFMDSLKRKIQEQSLAIELEKEISKEEILELYLNAIYLGQGSNGVQTAAETYFSKEDLHDLTISECATIAAITQSPTEFDPVKYPENNRKRRNIVLQYMLEQDMITEIEYTEAINDDVYSRINIQKDEDNSLTDYNSYYIDTVITELTDQLMEEYEYTETQAYNLIYSGGISIYINQDEQIQNICDEIINDSANYPAGTSVALNYALTLIDPTSGSLYNYSTNHLLNYYKEKTGNSKYNTIYSSEETARAAADEYKLHIIEKTGYKELAETFSTTIQPQSSFVVIDQATGQVKAVCGGRGPKTGNLTLNRAVDTTRQPGSTFKVLSTYVPALDTAGMTLATSYKDEPLNYSNGTPVKNWYSGYRDWQTIRSAIKDSLNIITVKCFKDVTPQVGYDYLCAMGITTLKNGETLINGVAENDINESMCLGGLTDGVTNLEITAAYASIANGGMYTEPTFYSKVLDHDGNVLIDNTPEKKSVMKETTAWLITDAMKDVVTSGTGTAARLSSGMPVAGKTGTTSSNYDYWFCGYTPYYTASIWMGYDSNTNFSNSNTHKIIWRKIMDRIVEEKGQDTSVDFKKPADIVTARVCATTGKLPAEEQCGALITEYFTSGTVPTEICDKHQTIKLCDQSHYKATEFCPETTTYHYSIEDGIIKIGEDEGVDFTVPEDFATTTCPLHKEAPIEENIIDGTPGTLDNTDRVVYTIYATTQDGGGIIAGPTSAYAGDTVTLTFLPNSGYQVREVSIDGVLQGPISSYTFTNISSDHRVIVSFVPITTEAPAGTSNKALHKDGLKEKYDTIMAFLSKRLQNIFQSDN